MDGHYATVELRILITDDGFIQLETSKNEESSTRKADSKIKSSSLTFLDINNAKINEVADAFGEQRGGSTSACKRGGRCKRAAIPWCRRWIILCIDAAVPSIYKSNYVKNDENAP